MINRPIRIISRYFLENRQITCGRMKPMKRWQFWLGILISAAFLVWAASKLQLGDVWTAMKSANYIWLVPGVAVWFVGLFVRTWRWHYMLRPLKKISTWKMFPVVAIGYFGNNVYPARAGEVLRAYVLRKREGVPISASLATVIVERIFDGVVMLAFVFLNLGQLGESHPGIRFSRRYPQPGDYWGSSLPRSAYWSFCWLPCSHGQPNASPAGWWNTWCHLACAKKPWPLPSNF